MRERWWSSLRQAESGAEIKNKEGAFHFLIENTKTMGDWRKVGEVLRESNIGNVLPRILEKFAKRTRVDADKQWANKERFRVAKEAILSVGETDEVIRRRDAGYHSLLNLCEEKCLSVEETWNELIAAHEDGDLRRKVRRRFLEMLREKDAELFEQRTET